MFIVCGANPQTFATITSVLEDFHSFSGLHPNLNKSACFFAGVDANLKQDLRSILNIPEANFPVKYLGVPLISTKLSNCKPEIE